MHRALAGHDVHVTMRSLARVTWKDHSFVPGKMARAMAAASGEKPVLGHREMTLRVLLGSYVASTPLSGFHARFSVSHDSQSPAVSVQVFIPD